jgi:hypothetical protein
MNSSSIRNILFIQAVEGFDEGGTVLTEHDKNDAVIQAGAPLPVKSARSVQQEFLATRADLLLSRLHAKFPRSSRSLDLHHGRSWFGVTFLVVGVLAVVLGFLSNELGPEKRINILSFPLLGILLWSFAIYLGEIVFFFTRRGNRGHGSGWLDGVTGFFESHGVGGGRDLSAGEDADSLLEHSRRKFEKDWSRLIHPVQLARLKVMLHTAAFLLAAAIIGGMYVNGLANEYRAVWESTFFENGSALRPFLSAVLGPAAAVSGANLPDATALDAIHWGATVNGETPGENAARWIHWYAITIGLFVLLPRAILAILWSLRAARLRSTLPFRDIAPRYFEHILSVSIGSSRAIRVVPYAFEPDDASRKSVIRALEDHFGRSIALTWSPHIAFGDEEEFSLESIDETIDLIPLFDFSATPEKETHLVVYQTLSALTPNPVRSILLDTVSFTAKAASLPDALERRENRESSWRKLYSGESVDLLFFPSLSSSPS